MNTRQLIAAAALLAASAGAFAQQTEFVAPDAGFVSTKSRAEVVAELNQAYSQNLLATQQRDGADGTALAASSRSRDQVRAEAQHARQDRYNANLYFGA